MIDDIHTVSNFIYETIQEKQWYDEMYFYMLGDWIIKHDEPIYGEEYLIYASLLGETDTQESILQKLERYNKERQDTCNNDSVNWVKEGF